MRLSRGENIEFVNSSGDVSTGITSTGGVYANGYPIFYTETGSTATSLKAYGCSFLSGSTTDRKVYTIDAPITGMRKSLVLYSSASTAAGDVSPLGSSSLTVVGTASTAVYFIDNTTVLNSDKHYLTFDRPYTAVELIGLSTFKYGVLSAIMASTILTAASTVSGAITPLGTSDSIGVVST